MEISIRQANPDDIPEILRCTRIWGIKIKPLWAGWFLRVNLISHKRLGKVHFAWLVGTQRDKRQRRQRQSLA